jgi:PAS domain S-box-containing protein
MICEHLVGDASLHAALAAAEARAAAAEARLQVLEGLLARMPVVMIEMEEIPGEQGVRLEARGAGLTALLGDVEGRAVGDPASWAGRLHEDDRERTIAAFHAGMGEGTAYVPPHRLRRTDGSEVWVELYMVRCPREGKSPARRCMLLVDVTGRKRAEAAAEAALREEQVVRQRLDDFIAGIPGYVWERWFSPDAPVQHFHRANAQVEAMVGYTFEDWENRDFWWQIIHPDDQPRALEQSRDLVARGGGTFEYRWIAKDGRVVWVMNRVTVIRDEAGAPVGLRGVTLDITEMKRMQAEQAEARTREEVLRAREESLISLSTPLVPIDDDVLAMPLVGTLEPRRADKVLETLLEGVRRSGARAVILDVTGVSEMDGRTAEALMRTARAVELLGAEVILTGIRPEVARTLVTLGADLGRIVTRSTLKAGIAHVMGRRRASPRPPV